MKNLKKMMVIVGFFMMQIPLMSGPVQDLKDAGQKKIEDEKQEIEKTIQNQATEFNRQVSQTWAQWLIEKLGLDRAEQVAQVIDYAAASAKKEISPEAVKMEKNNNLKK